MVDYEGINRELNPDWLGWLIFNLLADRTDETEEHRDEIQVQLDYEVKDYYFNKNAA